MKSGGLHGLMLLVSALLLTQPCQGAPIIFGIITAGAAIIQSIPTIEGLLHRRDDVPCQTKSVSGAHTICASQLIQRKNLEAVEFNITLGQDNRCQVVLSNLPAGCDDLVAALVDTDNNLPAHFGNFGTNNGSVVLTFPSNSSYLHMHVGMVSSVLVNNTGLQDAPVECGGNAVAAAIGNHGQEGGMIKRGLMRFMSRP